MVPKGYAGLHNCVVIILALIVLHVFWPHSILRKKYEVLLGAQVLWPVSVNIYGDVTRGAPLHLNMKNHTKLLMVNAKNSAEYMFK